MAGTRVPKQWCLTKIETVNSYESQYIIYTLSLDANFASFLTDGATWQKKTATNQHRSFTDDDCTETYCPTKGDHVRFNAGENCKLLSYY